jgi:hypothetical protein
VLDRAEFLLLLAGVPVGRLIFTINALPTVQPMTFGPGGRADRAVHDHRHHRRPQRSVTMMVAFEVDDLDPAITSGWSVTVTGRAAMVAGPSIIARYQSVPLVPWAPGQSGS